MDNKASRAALSKSRAEEKPISLKTFTFTDKNKGLSIEVVIPEVADPAYGMYTWPCAPVLAQYLWHHRHLIQGKVVLEIGSGTALCGVVAAKCGAQVTLSDSAFFSDCLANCRKTCQVNNMTDVSVIPLTWGLVTPSLLQLPAVDFILGSDCFYDTKDFEDVLVTVSFLLKRSPGCQFWCTYQKRSATRTIEFLLRKWGLAAREVPLSSLSSKDCSAMDRDCAGMDSVHMFVMTLNNYASEQCGAVT